MGKRIVIAEGDKFNRLTVIREANKRNKERFAEVICDCGVTKEVRFRHLRNGSITSCGCVRKHRHEGQKHGRWTILEEIATRKTEKSGRDRRIVVAQCDCGVKRELLLESILQGKSTSCGCSKGTHGMTRTKTYKSWDSAKYRCTNSSCHAWPDYGGRGIKFCERWMSFKNFLDDMGICPEGGTIERLDVDGDYCPENCVWLPKELQTLNRRNTIVFNISGEDLSLTDASKMYGVSGTTIARWCKGYIKKGRPMPPKDGCSWRWKYPESNKQQ